MTAMAITGAPGREDGSRCTAIIGSAGSRGWFALHGDHPERRVARTVPVHGDYRERRVARMVPATRRLPERSVATPFHHAFRGSRSAEGANGNQLTVNVLAFLE